eukprot:m.106078 g.106078  ORF g.106078 m.106078 type:complete len:118 (+) comp18979_c0_seq1:1449-1802(+)
MTEMSASPMILHIQSATLHEKLFLIACLMKFQKSGVEETVFGDVARTQVSLCRMRGVPPPTTAALASVCAQLGACRVLLVEIGEMDIFKRIRLNCSRDDVLFALRDDPTVVSQFGAS